MEPTLPPGPSSAGRCDGVGRIDLDFLQKTLPDNRGWFFVRGPKPFMASVPADLRRWGAPDERIRFEFFGPKQELNAAAA